MLLLIDGSSIDELAKKTGGLSRTVADLTSESGHVEGYADDFQETFNANAETLRRYANDRLDVGDVAVAIRFADREGNHSERYLVALADEPTSTLEEVRIVDPERFENLDRSIDRRVAVDWYLSRNAADELETFLETFADQNRDPPHAYVAKTAAKYGDSVEGDLVDELVDRFEES
jgi:hypothetical protein